MSSMDTPRAATRNVARSVGDKVDELQAKGQQATEYASDIGSTLKGALDDAIRTRPYMTLIAAG
ncbi:MAG: hypothetical protein JO000_29855, partial [Alphaproteobacteria bacterium]|nr:hypothetical protein [Alphaproteobacteria bacterium]